MNFFENIYENDTLQAEEAEVKVDLSGMEKPDAMQKLDMAIRGCKSSKAVSVYVSFDPARPGGGETLFQPVMRYFKVEKMNGYIEYAQPLMSTEKGGVFAVFKL